jgi:outer membrane protein assembly factor BamB
MNHFLRNDRFLKSRHPVTLALWGAMAGGAALVGGCNSGNGDSTAQPRTPAQTAASLQNIEQQMVIGPTAARDLGYRVDWQYPVAGPNLKELTVQFDSVFALDQNNYLTRINREDGTRVWRIPVSYPLAEVQGVIYLPDYGRVIIMSGGELFILNASDGSQLAKQRLDKIANTAPVAYGDQLIYGSRNGQLIWHSHAVAFQSAGYQIAQSINIQPVLRGNVIVTVGNDGEIMTLDASTASQFWRKKLLDGIAVPPTVGGGAVYLAGLDQHLWAYDLATGRNLWSYLTESPLTTSPVLIDDHVFQQIPREGLVCFDALPLGNPRGVIEWSAADVTGSVVTQRREELITWDQASQRLVTLTSLRGGFISEMRLPQVQRMFATNVVDGDIYASSADGRVVRLVPRN